MSEFVAITYDDELKAQEVRTDLLRMQKEHLVDLEDAVVAIKKPNGKIKLDQIYNLPAAGAWTGGFWGLLIGVLFLHPLLGAVVGSAIGAASGALSDVGIDNKFMKQLSRNMTPGSSTLFVLIRQITPDKVLEEIKGYGGTLIRTSLTNEQEQKLQAVLDEARQHAHA